MAYYGVFVEPSGSRLVMMKASSSPGTDGSWANIDDPVLMDPESLAIKSAWAYVVSTDIHVVTQQEGGRVEYHIFSTSSDTWTTRNEFVALGNGPLYPACSVAVRTDGDVIVGYAAASGGDQQILYARRESGTWTRDVSVAATASVDYTGVVIVRGSSDRMHFFFKDDTNQDAYQRTLNSSNSLESMPSAFDSSVTATAKLIFGPGFLTGTTVKCPYIA